MARKKYGKGIEQKCLKKCPKCGKRCGAPIFWGMPVPEDRAEMEQGARDGLLVFGGCCVSDDDAEFECTGCGHRWGSWAAGRDEIDLAQIPPVLFKNAKSPDKSISNVISLFG